jgi:RimJ/RimL family protein N-acetyltransferase
MLLYNHDIALSRWAGERLGISDWGPCRAIGVLRRGDLAAVAVFHHFRFPDIEISFVTCDKHWATPATVRGILRYPFLQVGCKRLTAITEATNQPTRAFLSRLGFHQEGVHPDVFLSGAAISYGLLRKDAAKWLREEESTGQIEPLAASGA